MVSLTQQEGNPLFYPVISIMEPGLHYSGAVTINKSMYQILPTPHICDFIRELNQKKIAFSDWPGEMGKFNMRPDNILQIFLQDPESYWIEVNRVRQE